MRTPDGAVDLRVAAHDDEERDSVHEHEEAHEPCSQQSSVVSVTETMHLELTSTLSSAFVRNDFLCSLDDMVDCVCSLMFLASCIDVVLL